MIWAGRSSPKGRPNAEIMPERREIVPHGPRGPRSETLFDGAFRVIRERQFVKFEFPGEPTPEQIEKLDQARFYRIAGRDLWTSPASAPQIEAAMQLVAEFSGRTELLEQGQAR